MSGEPSFIPAAGGILWEQQVGTSKLALVHRPRHGDWALPKGKLERGERWQDAALREVREETGCSARLEEFAGVVLYEVLALPKIVLFWNMTLVGLRTFTASDEVDELAWLEPRAALRKLDHDAERQIVRDQLKDR